MAAILLCSVCNRELEACVNCGAMAIHDDHLHDLHAKLDRLSAITEGLLDALEEVRDLSRDRAAFVAQGPRAWAKAEAVIDRALSAFDIAAKE